MWKRATVGLIALTLGGPVVADQISLATLDKSLELKADKADVLLSEDVDQLHCEKPTATSTGGCIKVGIMKNYAYVSTTTVPQIAEKGMVEDTSKRTENSVTLVQNDGTNILRVYTGKPFHKVGAEWHTIEYATTTIEAFDLQTKSVTEKLLGIFKVEADTFSAFSGAGDGYVQEDTAATYTTMRNAAGDTADYTTTPLLMRNQRGASNYGAWTRSIFQFDTSSLGAGATVSSSTVYIHADAANTQSSFACATATEQVNITTVNTDSDTTLAVTDYPIADYGDTILSATTTYTTWDTDAYVPFTLNATGLAAINVTAYTAFSVRTGSDIYETNPGCAAFGYRIYGMDTSETAGTASDPYIDIVYTPAAGGSTFTGDGPHLMWFE